MSGTIIDGEGGCAQPSDDGKFSPIVSLASGGIDSAGEYILWATTASARFTVDCVTAATRLPGDGLQKLATAPYMGGTLRYVQLMTALGPLVMGLRAATARGKGLPKAERDAIVVAYAEDNRDVPLKACLSLGGFYIKIGQMLAGFPAMPQPWAESLRTLQRDVPARPLEGIIAIIEDDFGCSLGDVGITAFSSTPLGSASIGQCHSAVLNGRDVVVKVMVSATRMPLARHPHIQSRSAALTPRIIHLFVHMACRHSTRKWSATSGWTLTCCCPSHASWTKGCEPRSRSSASSSLWRCVAGSARQAPRGTHPAAGTSRQAPRGKHPVTRSCASCSRDLRLHTPTLPTQPHPRPRTPTLPTPPSPPTSSFTSPPPLCAYTRLHSFPVLGPCRSCPPPLAV